MCKAVLVLGIIILMLGRPPLSFAADDQFPSSRYGAAMVYDEVNQRLILFGGSDWDAGIFYNDTWTYSYGSNAWQKLDTANCPPSRFNPGIVYINDRQAILIFGGYRTPDRHLNDTWLFDVKTNAWRELEPSARPTPRGNVGMAYDSKNRRVILFGGSSNSEYPRSDTWAYDFESNSWTEMHPLFSPKPQYGVGMVYDSLNELILLLEGHWVTRDQNGIVRDGYDGGLYTYDYVANNWSRVECTTPPGRYWYSTAYDSNLGRMIIFGGIRWLGRYGNMYNETWIYNTKTNAWSKPIGVGPEKRYISAMAYDRGNGVTVLFGGADVIGEAPGGGDLRIYHNDTWALSSAMKWIELNFTSTPTITPTGDTNNLVPNIQTLLIISVSVVLVALIFYMRRSRSARVYIRE